MYQTGKKSSLSLCRSTKLILHKQKVSHSSAPSHRSQKRLLCSEAIDLPTASTWVPASIPGERFLYSPHYSWMPLQQLGATHSTEMLNWLIFPTFKPLDFFPVEVQAISRVFYSNLALDPLPSNSLSDSCSPNTEAGSTLKSQGSSVMFLRIPMTMIHLVTSLTSVRERDLLVFNCQHPNITSLLAIQPLSTGLCQP